ncbi:signal recognition particle-docking protein FtsY [Nostoc sp. PA-18-2419]|uniref:signal recognition particle-docking protein FtsY n=1 Tax=Nostoc sp. PA-18-2419 TaxID=2575443 RepID=UPI0011090599|nr:signal recognition particle-docking protein FtsY [Nostoc sp. PA-18-2419]
MVFNWFRRQYNDSSETPSEKKQEQTPPVQEPQPETAETSSDTTTDLLAFAKAAYKNIQQKQQSQPGETQSDSAEALAPSELPETTETVTSEIETQAIEQVTATTQRKQAEGNQTTTDEESIEDSPVTAIADQSDVKSSELTANETQITTTEPLTTPETTQPTVPSFLERAAAERQAKLEQLIASAIEVPEPEVVQPVLKTQDQTPVVVFDDGFVWSAEVLAAQGRRAEDVSIEEITWLKKLRQGLDKTRRGILNQLKAIVGKGPLNQAAISEIEALLLQADVGVEATDLIIDALQKKLLQEVTPPEEAIAYLKQILRDMLDTPGKTSHKSSFTPEKETLNIWLITGVNGAGKTTTIGKIAHLGQKSGYKCLIGAADTFRAAAVEQVKVWGSRSGVEVIANPGKNTDPAAVVFDAIAAAQARQTELLLVDTAGRLQNKKNLMDELSKIRRIIDKKAPNAKVESLLVLDATLGQNGLRQAEIFSQAAQLSGVVLTKLDGTAKGGVALAVVQQLGLPIRFIGAGEGIEDLRPFSSYEFVEALLSS